jgi:hypothetical protein
VQHFEQIKAMIVSIVRVVYTLRCTCPQQRCFFVCRGLTESACKKRVHAGEKEREKKLLAGFFFPSFTPSSCRQG